MVYLTRDYDYQAETARRALRVKRVQKAGFTLRELERFLR